MFTFHIGLLCISTLTALSAMAGFTAQANTNDEYEIYEITSRKESQPFIDAPVSALVVGGDYIEWNQIADIQTLTTALPGVFAAPNSQSSKLFVRGVGSQGNAGMDQAVSVYVDHVFHSRSRMIEAGLFDINTVEVLKGPQGTHLGLNTTAGAFVMQTRGAELNNSDGTALLTYGDNQQVIGQWAQNMALSSQAALRIAAKLGTDDGFWRMRSDAFPEADANSGTQTSAVRLSGIWQPNEVFSASAKVEYQRIEKDNPFAWQPGGCNNLYGLGLSSQTELNTFWAQTGSQNDNPLRVPVTCREGFIDNEFDRYSPSSPFNRSEFEYFISNLQLNWQWQNTQIWWNSAWFNMNYGFSGNDLSHGTSAQRLFYSTDDNQQFSQEVRLISPLSSSAVLTAGGYWHRGITDYVTADADGRNQQNPRFVQSTANQTETRTSLFAQLAWQLLSDVTLDLGYR